MDLRHNQLPWSEQIWAKIHADLAQALAQSRRVRAPFEVFHVPPETQTVMADIREEFVEFLYSESDTTPIVELSSPFSLRQSQVFNEGGNFAALDRIISAAHAIGVAEDTLILTPGTNPPGDVTVVPVRRQDFWDGLYLAPLQVPAPPQNTVDLFVLRPYRRRNAPQPAPGQPIPPGPVGLELFNAVIDARNEMRMAGRHDPYALILSSQLEGEISATVPGSNSLNTPVERLRALATAGIYGTPALQGDTAVLVSVSRSWVDIAQALEPSVQFLRIDENGDYRLRLVERFAFRLKDRSARCMINLHLVP